MSLVIWNESPGTWTAQIGETPVCTLKTKDIGGCTATWLNGMLWAPPAHMPKAKPQPACFFSNVEDAKQAVEKRLLEA
jgi:hypothetical protein